MLRVHFAPNWEFQVDFPDGHHEEFSKLSKALERCGSQEYTLTPTLS
jgi:hypothetical protein